MDTDCFKELWKKQKKRNNFNVLNFYRDFLVDLDTRNSNCGHFFIALFSYIWFFLICLLFLFICFYYLFLFTTVFCIIVSAMLLHKLCLSSLG